MTSPIMTPTSSGAGFTLVELLLVMVIIATAAAMAIPRYAGSIDYMRLRSAALDLAATAENAQHTALIEGRTLRLRISEDGRTCTVETDGYDINAGDSKPRRYTLPERIQISSLDFDDPLLAHRTYVTFKSDGYVDRSMITLEDRSPERFRVHLESGVGAIRVTRVEKPQ